MKSLALRRRRQLGIVVAARNVAEQCARATRGALANACEVCSDVQWRSTP